MSRPRNAPARRELYVRVGDGLVQLADVARTHGLGIVLHAGELVLQRLELALQLREPLLVHDLLAVQRRHRLVASPEAIEDLVHVSNTCNGTHACIQGRTRRLSLIIASLYLARPPH
jgi:hypothetical protein